MRLPNRHPSIRLRLALVYAVVLVGTCTVLLGLNYVMLYRSLYTNIQAPSPEEVAAWAAVAVHDEAFEEKFSSFQQQQATIARLRADLLLGTAGASAIALAVTALLGLGVSWFVAGRMLRPLRSLTAATRRISQDRLHERIALDGPHDELKELADNFDEMVARLEASFNSQRRFVAHAAHELRTPLAIVRTGAEVQLAKRQATPEQWRAMAHRALAATGRAERMLDGLLALARSDSGAIAGEAHDLAVAAAGALSDADDEAERAKLTITTDLRPAPVTGDPALLDRLLSNLVDNAVRHNHPGGWVEVVTGRGDRQAVVTVRNSGGPVPRDEVDRLFEPWQRLTSQRITGAGSTGLGLAIVRSIVDAHGGIILAVPNSGGGLTVTVALP
jgi:signal transduction histidine kinase